MMWVWLRMLCLGVAMEPIGLHIKCPPSAVVQGIGRGRSPNTGVQRGRGCCTARGRDKVLA